MKWLCDHEKLVKQQLSDDINRLTVEIRDDEKSNEVNWLDSQHKVIEKKESLVELRKMLERLTVHEKEMVAVKERRSKESKAKVKYKSVRTSESSEADDHGEKGEDDEFIIDNYDDKDNEDDEVDDKRYPGVQVCRISKKFFVPLNPVISCRYFSAVVLIPS